jgi:hypothetical protein
MQSKASKNKRGERVTFHTFHGVLSVVETASAHATPHRHTSDYVLCVMVGLVGLVGLIGACEGKWMGDRRRGL